MGRGCWLNEVATEGTEQGDGRDGAGMIWGTRINVVMVV
ncbi:hypothetical protein Golob_002383, partial [Gossypium lobatum]|nr:hypothetical protein [Gossypium lobatum]